MHEISGNAGNLKFSSIETKITQNRILYNIIFYWAIRWVMWNKNQTKRKWRKSNLPNMLYTHFFMRTFFKKILDRFWEKLRTSIR